MSNQRKNVYPNTFGNYHQPQGDDTVIPETATEIPFYRRVEGEAPACVHNNQSCRIIDQKLEEGHWTYVVFSLQRIGVCTLIQGNSPLCHCVKNDEEHQSRD